jgi:hypothetical protein
MLSSTNSDRLDYEGEYVLRVGTRQRLTILPSYLGLPFRILVSPFVHFDPETRTTDIMMFSSRNLGALIVDEDPHVKSWEDGQYNIQHMSIEETRSLHPSKTNTLARTRSPASGSSVSRIQRLESHRSPLRKL